MEWLIQHGRAALLGVTFMLMVWGIGAAPAASEPQNCAPRPEIGVSVAPAGQVVVSARTSPGVPTNQLGSLAFGTATNAFIDVPGGQTGSRGNFTVTLAPGTQQTSFWVRTATSGQAATVPLVVVDNCGSWSTLVGGALPVATPTALPSTTPTPVSLAPTAIKLPASPVAGAGHASTPTIVSVAAAPAPTAAANVGVSVAPSNGGALSVTIVARAASCTAANQLRQLAFGNDPATYRNAQVAIDGQVRTPPFTVSLPPGTTQKTFDVLQVAAGQGATVPLVAQDSCGQWNTFVGGGANAFSPPLTALPTASPLPTLVEGVPVCTDHDSTKYHSLVKRDSAGAILCTYGHEHHDDPNSVNDLFGLPGAWFGPGQEISYPWQTFTFPNPQADYYPVPQPDSSSLFENAAKHNGYKWYVKRNLSCVPAWAALGPPNDGCFRAYRVQVHSLGTTADSTVRFHSFSMEALVEQGGKQGVVRGGGWMDSGFLGLLVDGGDSMICPSLSTNPPGFTCPITGTAGTVRTAGSTNVPSPHISHSVPGSATNWYAAHRGGVQVGVSVEDFGPIDYANPSRQQFYPSQYRANNSHGRAGALSASTQWDWLRPYTDASGRITFRGYEGRHGELATGCTAPGLDCVPFIVDGAPAGTFILAAGLCPQECEFGDHDVLSPITGNSLIRYPN
jgi:hypothetical protein